MVSTRRSSVEPSLPLSTALIRRPKRIAAAAVAAASVASLQQHSRFKRCDYYSILGVDRTATTAQIQSQFRRRALELHPDRRGNSSEASNEFALLAQIYRILSDPQQRQIYDLTGFDTAVTTAVDFEAYGNTFNAMNAVPALLGGLTVLMAIAIVIQSIIAG